MKWGWFRKKKSPVDIILVSDDLAMIRDLILFFCISAVYRKIQAGEIHAFWCMYSWGGKYVCICM